MYNFLDKTGLSYFWQLIKAKITKEQVGLGNVENKSSATIRSEITKENVTTALGYTPPENDTTYSDATTSTAGLMSASDKSKLDGVASGANNYSHPTYTAKSSGLYKVTVDSTGHVSGTTAVTKSDITALGIPESDTNTTTTAGASNTSSKIYLVGATSQSSAPTTYSHDTVYVGTDGHLYSNSKQAVNLSDSQALTNKTYNGYTLGAACAKGVDTTATSGSGNLITSGAMYTALSGKANYEVKLSADFNTMTTPGLYTMKSSSTNAPTNGSFHSLIVNKSDNGNYVQQIAIKESTCDMYIRYLSSSTWSSWKQVAMSEAVQTAYDLANTANTKANIKKNSNATDGDIISTHLTVGTRSGTVGTNSIISGTSQTASGGESAILGGHSNTASGASTGILGGFLNTAVGEASIVLGGYENSTGSTSASNAVIVGSKNTTDGLRSAIIAGHDNKISCDGENSAVLGGVYNQATQQNSVVVGGNNNTASGNANSLVAGGYSNTASADNSVIVGGGENNATGRNSTVAGGCGNTTSGDNSVVVGGYSNTALAYQLKTGHYSKDGIAGSIAGTTGDAFIIGNGSSATNRSNAFRVAYDGNCYAATAMNSTGADYAECFEWADGNPDNEDRIGFMTAFEGDKIRFANENDPVEIIGVVSALPAVVGDNYADEWCGKYLKDKYGRLITEHKVYEAEYRDVEAEEEIELTAEEISEMQEEITNDETLTDDEKAVKLSNIPTTKTVKVTKQELVHEAYEADEYVLNPDYNADEEYIPRLKRKEYSAVGTHGKLAVRDDGTCDVGGFCRSGNGGIATKSDSGFYVMERIDDETVRIYIK